MPWNIVDFMSNHSAFLKDAALYDSISNANMEIIIGELAQRYLIRELLMGLSCWQGLS